MNSNERRTLVSRYTQNRMSIRSWLNYEHQHMVDFLVDGSTGREDRMDAIVEAIAYDSKTAVQLRQTMAEQRDEFYVATGEDLHAVMTEAFRNRGWPDVGDKSLPRTKDEIVQDFLRCEDPYAISAATESAISAIEHDDAHYSYVNMDNITDELIDRLETVRCHTLIDEWNITYPDEDFWEARDKAIESYDREQSAMLGKYIDLEKAANSCYRDADGYAKSGDAKAYSDALDRIKSVRDEQVALSDEFVEKYGRHDINGVASERYDEICPDDDFEWYVSDDGFGEEESGRENDAPNIE